MIEDGEEREGRVKYPWIVEVWLAARGILRIGDVSQKLRDFGIGSPMASVEVEHLEHLEELMDLRASTVDSFQGREW
ncbi:hypothetical protein ODS41_12185 [Pyrobaculum sp. 3827-6]|nr:hypothetical protein [Pyrobaculum sp. 3827-6]